MSTMAPKVACYCLCLAFFMIMTVVQAQGNGTARTNALTLDSVSATSAPSKLAKMKQVNLKGDSLVSCGLTCLERKDCDMFCYDVTTSNCFVTSGVESPDGPIVDTSSLCFSTAGRCPSNQDYDEFEGTCLQLLDGLFNYTQGRTACTSRGGHVFYLKTRDDFDTLKMFFLKNGLDIGDHRVWLGARNGTEGAFLWEDGTPLNVHSPPVPWYNAKQPDNVGGKENCLEYRYVGLNDERCPTAAQKVVCQTNPVPTV